MCLGPAACEPADLSELVLCNTCFCEGVSEQINSYYTDENNVRDLNFLWDDEFGSNSGAKFAVTTQNAFEIRIKHDEEECDSSSCVGKRFFFKFLGNNNSIKPTRTLIFGFFELNERRSN